MKIAEAAQEDYLWGLDGRGWSFTSHVRNPLLGVGFLPITAQELFSLQRVAQPPRDTPRPGSARSLQLDHNWTAYPVGPDPASQSDAVILLPRHKAMLEQIRRYLRLRSAGFADDYGTWIAAPSLDLDLAPSAQPTNSTSTAISH